MALTVIAVGIWVSSVVTGKEHSMNGTVYFDAATDKYSIKLGVVDCASGVACGRFNDSLNITGWGNLEIRTSRQSSAQDMNRMYGAGFLEGYITSYQIANSYFAGWNEQTKATYGPYYEDIRNWTQQQSAWMKHQIESHPDDEYWQYVQALQAQYEGLKAGYNAAAKDLNDPSVPALEDDMAWQYLNGNAEWDDLVAYFEYFVYHTKDPNDWLHCDDPDALYMSKLRRSRCSALVKVSPELDDLYISHSTWSDYW